MIGRIIRIAANEFLRLPPTSMREAQLRALNQIVRSVFKRIAKR